MKFLAFIKPIVLSDFCSSPSLKSRSAGGSMSPKFLRTIGFVDAKNFLAKLEKIK